jgi:hypothetical protein
VKDAAVSGGSMATDFRLFLKNKYTLIGTSRLQLKSDRQSNNSGPNDQKVDGSPQRRRSDPTSHPLRESASGLGADSVPR